MSADSANKALDKSKKSNGKKAVADKNDAVETVKEQYSDDQDFKQGWHEGPCCGIDCGRSRSV